MADVSSSALPRGGMQRSKACRPAQHALGRRAGQQPPRQVLVAAPSRQLDRAASSRAANAWLSATAMVLWESIQGTRWA